ncbi:MAG TPA: hypothetical protein PLQ41_00225 [bacterium]|nr:hypothetical protein [bacterium]HPP29802.1 hypothetical protein [bacterium]
MGLLKLLIILSSFLLISQVKSEEIIRQDELTVNTVSPQENEIQYVGNWYTNGGIYSIALTKTQKTDGSIKVNYTRGHYMDDASKRSFSATDSWVWNGDEQSTKKENGAMWLNTQYQNNEVGLHTWTTYIYWDGWEFTGMGWKYSGGGSISDTNNFEVKEPGGCS